MRRRTLLAALAAGATGLGGCQGSRSGADGTSPSATARTLSTGTTGSAVGTTAGTNADDGEGGTGADDDGGGLSVEGGPVEAPDLAWTVEKRSPVTEDRPCRIRVAVENVGATRDLTAAGALPYPITPGEPADGDDGFRPAVVPVGTVHDREFWGSCWRSPLDDPRMADDAPWSWGYGEEETRTLRAGERIAGTYHVVSSTTRYCFQRGEYRFPRRYELAGREYEWEFALGVPSYDRDP